MSQSEKMGLSRIAPVLDYDPGDLGLTAALPAFIPERSRPAWPAARHADHRALPGVTHACRPARPANRAPLPPGGSVGRETGSGLPSAAS